MKMGLTTQFSIPQDPIWQHPPSLFFLGSCFSDEMAKRFSDHSINLLCNPLGTLFSPESMAKALEILSGKVAANWITDTHNQAICLDVSHKVNKTLDPTKLNHLQEQFQQFIQKSDTAFITLGTAFTYWHKESNQWVGNCHKLPSTDFEKKLLTVNQIKNCLERITHSVQAINPQMRIIFTVSPVKHLRDGIIENLRSKSNLLSAVHDFIEETTGVRYFPSFEIVQEELRDHQFYAADLAHPNEWAADYIFNRLIETYSDSNFEGYWSEAYKLHTMRQHRLMDQGEQEQWNAAIELQAKLLESKYH